jgi:hypothetical protein
MGREVQATSKRGAQTKKACRLGKPLMFFDVSYLISCLVAGVGFEPTTFGL